MTLSFNRVVGIFFSPTKTTKKIVEEIVKGTEIRNTLLYDFTLPNSRNTFPDLNMDDLVIFGVPTYAGRVPNVLLKYLDTIDGNNAVACPIVTFGNRAYDNSLYELKEILISHNFRVNAAAAFSTQHSFSDTLNLGRPNKDDLDDAYTFGSKLLHCEIKPDILIPGDLEIGYFKPKDRNGEDIDILKVKPITNSNCSKCMECVNICPMGVIDSNDPSIINNPCIKCNACVKFCKFNAKEFVDEKYLYHKKELEFLYGFEKKKNEFFF